MVFIMANSSLLLYYYTSVVHEYGADAFYKEKVTGQLYFCCNWASRFCCNNFSSPLAMQYNKFALSLRLNLFDRVGVNSIAYFF